MRGLVFVEAMLLSGRGEVLGVGDSSTSAEKRQHNGAKTRVEFQEILRVDFRDDTTIRNELLLKRARPWKRQEPTLTNKLRLAA